MGVTPYGGCQSKRITESGYITADGKKGLLYGYCVLSGTDATSIIFNSGGSSGTALWKDAIKGTSAASDASILVTFPEPIYFENDIYATLAGSGATASVCYRNLE